MPADPQVKNKLAKQGEILLYSDDSEKKYRITPQKQFEIIPTEAEIVRTTFLPAPLVIDALRHEQQKQ